MILIKKCSFLIAADGDGTADGDGAGNGDGAGDGAAYKNKRRNSQAEQKYGSPQKLRVVAQPKSPIK